MFYRLYSYDPVGSTYNKDGTGFVYNTGRFNSSVPLGQGCGNADPQGFPDFPTLLTYAGKLGETLRGPITREQVNAICGGLLTVDLVPIAQQVGAPSTTSGTGGTGGSCTGSTCPGPVGVAIGAPSGTPTAPNVPCSPFSTQACTGYNGSAPHPGNGTLTGGGSGTGAPVPAPTTDTGTQPGPGSSTGPMAQAGFNFMAFIKSPLGILALGLIIVILLTRHGAP